MKKIVLAVCALIPVIAHGADNETPFIFNETPFIFRFSDEPGSYKIKGESVKDVNGPIEARTYAILTSFLMKDHVQEKESENLVCFCNLHKDATHARISIRKLENGEFKRGGYVFFAAQMLRDKAAELKNKDEYCLVSKRYDAGIAMENQFENLAQSTYIPTIGSDTIYLP